MDKIEEWKKKTPKLIGGNGDNDFSYVVRPDQLDDIIQLVREECKPKWIPVGERLPEKSGWFWALIGSGESQYTDRAFFEKNEPNYHDCWIGGSEECDIHDVTHWQPLQEEPTHGE